MQEIWKELENLKRQIIECENMIKKDRAYRPNSIDIGREFYKELAIRFKEIYSSLGIIRVREENGKYALVKNDCIKKGNLSDDDIQTALDRLQNPGKRWTLEELEQRKDDEFEE